jgi:beta-glucosidase
VPQWFEDGRLRFAVGIEDTFVPHSALGRRALDEYELTQHYRFWADDLGLAAATGAEMIRYGFPWYRLNPAPGRYVWDWADRVVDRLEELGLEAIVDLMHYGTPLWMDNQFLNHAYPQAVAEYAGQLAERYRGRLRLFTPLNEPLINAMFCGETGTWPPYLTGDDGFVKLLGPLVKGIVMTQQAIEEATAGDATFVHVEATFRYVGQSDDLPDNIDHARRRQFVAEDLLTGRVDSDHDLVGYLRSHGFSDDDLEWCRTHTAHPDVMGINYYPHLTTTEYVEGEPLGRPRNDWTMGLEDVLRAFAGRYSRPVFLTETSFSGSTQERLAWLDASVGLVRQLRNEDIDVVGYTWWPLFHLIDWEYRTATAPVEEFIVPMGMYDLEPDSIGTLHRHHTEVVDRFVEHARADH